MQFICADQVEWEEQNGSQNIWEWRLTATCVVNRMKHPAELWDYKQSLLFKQMPDKKKNQ